MAQNRIWNPKNPSSRSMHCVKLTLLCPAGWSSICRSLPLPVFPSIFMQKHCTHLHLCPLIPKETPYITEPSHTIFSIGFFIIIIIFWSSQSEYQLDKSAFGSRDSFYISFYISFVNGLFLHWILRTSAAFDGTITAFISL